MLKIIHGLALVLNREIVFKIPNIITNYWQVMWQVDSSFNRSIDREDDKPRSQRKSTKFLSKIKDSFSFVVVQFKNHIFVEYVFWIKIVTELQLFRALMKGVCEYCCCRSCCCRFQFPIMFYNAFDFDGFFFNSVCLLFFFLFLWQFDAYSSISKCLHLQWTKRRVVVFFIVHTLV